ncbi:alpha/beta hydrolase [uncultured Aquimarina sp.]|uniref:alpha/beta hydrolase n=1 Tax=uncultured Aquimarina sp. TaxID=575652 RepID=UPI00260A26A1|nr:alpha/beta hydrolase [uncultured Aquimarina sp.]
MQHQEYFFEYKKHKLFGQYWLPEDSKAMVVLVHGMGEHSSRYADYVIPQLLEKNIGVITYDNFGHGKSGGKRGHCPSYEALIEVIDVVYRKSKEIAGDLPVFLYGHSMGGNLVINYVMRNNGEIAGAILTSPFLRLAFQPPAWKLTMGKLFQKIAPSITLPSGLDVQAISRVTEEVEKYKNDPLVHDKVSSNFSIPVIDAGEWAIAHASQLEKPILLVHGTADQITDYNASLEFAKKTDHVEFVSFDDGYHELHNDIEKEKFIKKIISWINTKV